MKKFLKIAAVVVVLLIVAAAGGGVYVWRGVKAIPKFYSRPVLTGEERLRAIESFDRKVLNLQSSLDQAYVRANMDPAAATQPATQPAAGGASQVLAAAEANRPLSVTFTGPELGTYFDKWLRDSGYERRVAKYMTDPRLVLEDGRLILAGQMPEFDAVVSLHFRPSVDEAGVVHLKLEDVYAGRIPLPASAFEKFKRRTAEALVEKVPALQREADISADGFANDAAVQLAAQRQLAELLEEGEVERVVAFLPLPGRGNVPARVSTLRVDEEGLTLGVELMNRADRAAFLAEIRKPNASRDAGETARADR